MSRTPCTVGLIATHPIQYYVPWYQALARHPDLRLHVAFCHRATPEDQARAGFGVGFTWDRPLLSGYDYRFLTNRARRPALETFAGCDTPDVGAFLDETRCDAVILHGWRVKSEWQTLRAARRRGLPVLVRGDSHLLNDRPPPKRWLKWPAYRWLMAQFAAFLIVGQRAAEYYRYYGADPRAFYQAPHAVDNVFFAERRAALEAERPQLRRRWGIPDDAVVFLFAGKLIPRKRPHDILRAVGEVRVAGRPVWGLIAGDGPLRAELTAVAKRRRLPVTFTGFLNQTEMPQAYTAADALVLPSVRDETWGLVVNEAMASGRPALVSDRVGCAPDLIRSGETGEVFRGGEVRALAALLGRLAQEPARLAAMGEAARRHIARYSVEAAVEGTAAALRAVSAK